MNRGSDVSIFAIHQAQQFLDGKLQPFDFAFSYSSLEHSGLGRYGAAIYIYGCCHDVNRMHSLRGQQMP